jgi:hypothetical protein
MYRRLTLIVVLIVSLLLVGNLFSSSMAIAQNDPNTRTAQWHETQYGTNAWGGSWILGQFGPDVGMGEQGTYYQMSTPGGGYVSYYSASPGMGYGGPMMGYGGMFSPVAQQSYGPYAGGGRPQVQQTPGYDTQGYVSGNLWGQSTNYYSAQPNPMFGLMMGLLGGFGGFGGFGGYGGYGGYSAGYGGYGGGYGYGYPGYGYGGYSGYGGGLGRVIY